METVNINLNKLDFEVDTVRSKKVNSNGLQASTKNDKAAKADTDNAINRKNNLDNKEIHNIETSLNKFLKSIQTDLQVEIHKETKTAVFKIVKRDDKSVISEVPPSKLLDIEVRIREMVGSLFDTNV